MGNTRPHQYDAALAITTHNRKDELRAAIDSALAQSLGERLQVLIVDDGSTDGTSEMLRAEYGGRANVKLDAVHPGIGLIAERNRFPELVDAPIIVSMDDDAVFPSTRTIEQTLDTFHDSDLGERIGAVAIPFIDVHIRPEVVQQRSPESGVRLWACEQYRGTAHAIRRDLFVAIGRYRGQLFRQGEEGDYAIRMLDAGRAVVLGEADPIHHLESPRRKRSAIYEYTARNNIWFAWHNVPMPILIPHLLGTTGNLKLLGLRQPRTLLPRFSGLMKGWWGMVASERGERRPVSAQAYRLMRALRKGGPRPLDELIEQLPRLRTL